MQGRRVAVPSLRRGVGCAELAGVFAGVAGRDVMVEEADTSGS